MKSMKFNFKEVDERQPSLIVKLAPTSEDGTYGEAIVEFGGLLEPKEYQGMTKDGRSFKTVRYEMLAKPLEGIFIDVINKEEVPKKDKSGRIIGKDLIPKSYTAEELSEVMKSRGNEYVIIRLSQSNYEFLRRNVNSGKITKGDIIKLQYTIGSNGGAIIRKILKAEIMEDDENIDSENHQ